MLQQYSAKKLTEKNIEKLDIIIENFEQYPLYFLNFYGSTHIDLLFELPLSRQEKAPEDIFCRWFAIDQIENSRIRRVVAKLSP